MRWYIVQARSNREKRVRELLSESIKDNSLDSQFGRILVPVEEVVEMKDGKKRKSERKLYPGYVFVEMDMNEKTWKIVSETPNVSSFIGSEDDRGLPRAMPPKEVESMLSYVESAIDRPKPKTVFDVGEMVRVNEGPFADFSGVIEEVNYEKSKLKVSVLIFGRATPLELDFTQVEKES